MDNSPPRARKNIPRAVRAVTLHMADGFCEEIHSHPEEGQLKWAATGVLSVPTLNGVWVLPSDWAAWLPAAQAHGGVAHGVVTNHNLYILREHCASMPSCCRAIPMSGSLQRALADAVAARTGYDLPSFEDDQRLIAMVNEACEAPGLVPVQLPLQVSGVVAAVFDALDHGRGQQRTLPEWGAALGVSARSFARLIQAQTGMSFGSWRTNIQLLRALRELAQGRDVVSVSRELGYTSPSNFIAMFRRNLASTPARYYHGTSSARDPAG